MSELCQLCTVTTYELSKKNYQSTFYEYIGGQDHKYTVWDHFQLKTYGNTQQKVASC